MNINLNSNWRTTLSETGVNSSNLSKLNGNNGVNQKSGAERLFQYFEADDSDPEDYARYLNIFIIKYQ